MAAEVQRIENEGLEPTYEGLKHKPSRGLSCWQATGLEPTYEGLKLCAPCHRRWSPRSLEPTYEGLKLVATVQVKSGFLAFGAYL